MLAEGMNGSVWCLPPTLSSCGLPGVDIAGPPSSSQGREGEGLWVATSRGGWETGGEPSQCVDEG